MRSTFPWTNVVYLNLTTDGTYAAADLANIISSVASSYNTNVVPQLVGSVTVEDFHAVWITGPGTALEYDLSTSYVGSKSGTDVADNSSCAVVNWAINQYYRGGHPRTYHTSLTTTSVVNGSQLTAAFQSALATAYDNWMTAVNALTHGDITSCTLGTVSYARGNVWRVPPVFYAYKSASVRTFMGTQRRRIGGR